MSYTAHIMRLSVCGIATILISLWSADFAAADAPGEEFFVEAGDIDPVVLQDAVGVLSLNLFIDYQGGQEVTQLKRYRRDQSGNFTDDGMLAVKNCVAISGVPWDSFRVLRFPIVEALGNFRKIVCDPIRNDRAWIDFAEISELFASLRVDDYHENTIDELYFHEDTPGSYIDIFSLSLNGSRKLYRSPDENAEFSILSPASKPLTGLQRQGGRYHYGLFFQQIRNGFGEVWAERGDELPPEQLGWLKIVDESYQHLGHYFLQGGVGTLVSVFFLTGETKRRKLYHTPDEQASFRLIEPDGFPFGRRLTVMRIKNGFALLADYDYCFTDRLRPIGWIKIRDHEHKLTLWPVAPSQCT